MTEQPDQLPDDLPTDKQVMGCLNCGLAGLVPPAHLPMAPGLWPHPCPQCGKCAVWVTPPPDPAQN